MSAHTDTQRASSAATAAAPRGGGVAQVLWYADPGTDPKQIGREIAAARDDVERSAELLSYFVERNPRWFDLDKYRRVHMG